jgi:hypothetical protein
MFVYSGDNKNIRLAVSVANKYDLLNYVYGEILRAPKYDYSNAPNTYIAKKWYEFMRTVDINVKVYYPKYRWSKAMGYFTPLRPRDINVNGYKINSMSQEMLISLFYHESGHSWNESDNKYNVHHGDNNKAGKKNTMMYSINRYVYKFFDYEYKPKTYKPWYKIIFSFLKWW